MILLYIFIGFGLLLTILMCWQESKKRKISFGVALLFCLLLSPIVGYFIIISKPLRNPVGCKWCGNKENEVEFCGICGKNAAGLTREGI